VFTLNDEIYPSEEGMDSNLPYCRRLFELNDVLRKKVVRTTRTMNNKEYSDAVNIAVHIRRGDLFGYILASSNTEQMAQRATSRLVPVSAYKSVLGQLLSKLKKISKTNVHIHIFCEGMKVPFMVQEVNGTYIDLRRDILVYNSSIQNVTFFHGATNPLEAFDAMCFSDILITGTSGFSYLASILCKTPVIMAVPFWHSYHFVPNAVLLDVTKENYTLPYIKNLTIGLISSMQFNESHFEELWQENTKK
jgi:hypothetical protein